MGAGKIYNILMYSHDTYGLGHIRRTMAIAAGLRAADVNVLILTGSPIAGRFTFPENVDFVRIPGMIKKTNDEYHSLSIRIDPDHALQIRKDIILATARSFQPDLFIVDKEPLGLKKEVLPTLEWLKECRPMAKTVLGLRDVMDDRETVRRDWQHKGIYDLLDSLYSEIWIYGKKDIYDAVKEYKISDDAKSKTMFTGYLPRRRASEKTARKTRKRFCAAAAEKLLVVTAGGGGDGFDMMDAYLEMLEKYDLPDVASVLITGPFMPRNKRAQLAKRSRPYRVKIRPFYPRMEELFGAADLVVSMGGYNTICEILSQGTPTLVVPRETPRKEQLIRAGSLQKKHVLEYLPWKELSGEKLYGCLQNMLTDLDSYEKAIARFPLDGLECIKSRLQHFRDTRQGSSNCN